jgi:hypothetical protein
MKNLYLIFFLFFTVSCGMKIPYTDDLKKEYNLDEKSMKKVQFYTSATIILEKSKTRANQTTASGGTLVSSSSSQQDRIIIPVNTKCVFEKFGDEGEIFVRFEQGQNRFIKFAVRPNLQAGRYYLAANWQDGGKLQYGNDEYTTSAQSANAFLSVITKKLDKTKRKDRIVKGMKV